MKKILIIIIIAIIGVGAFYFFGIKPSPEEKSVMNELEGEEIKVEKVSLKDNEVFIKYSQPIDLSEENLYATWGYIFSVANKANPEAQIYVVECKFKDGEKVRITAPREAVASFAKWEMSGSDFLQELEVEPLTGGPQMR